ncbi:hypothetical protein RIR_jg21446.t1 [Rhizophagus irregularis DAOM 181602=DAOM 197198]|nr:hypothetical protein RIR_jg21446.t1 [Rhizophagus irregularis DAOM 181602=DAOM 197198]
MKFFLLRTFSSISNLSNETNKQKYLLPDRFLRQDLVGNEITQNNTNQYSNSTFKVYVTKVENKEYNLEFSTENERM